MRLAASCAGIAMAWFAVASAQAACLNANEPDQSAEGRLTSVSISIPDYKLKEQAAILRLSSVACLEAAASSNKVETHQRIHVFAMDNALRRLLRQLAGKRVRVTGEPFGDHTAHHHTRVEPAARR
jgi:hypothetical protein